MVEKNHNDSRGYTTSDLNGRGEQRNLHIENVNLHRPSIHSSNDDPTVRYSIVMEGIRPDRNNPSNNQGHHLITNAVSKEYSYGILGLLLGIVAILGGILLSINGVAGSVSWTAKVLGLESQINDAAPGVVLFIIGLFIVWVTKPRVRIKDLKY